MHEIPFRQVAVNTTHEVNNPMTKENSIELSFHVPKSLMKLGSNLNGIHEVALVRINSFVLFVSSWYFAQSLDLSGQVSIVSAEQANLVRLGVFEKSVDDGLTDCTGCASNEDVETVVVSAEVHVVKMCFIC